MLSYFVYIGTKNKLENESHCDYALSMNINSKTVQYNAQESSEVINCFNLDRI